MNRDTNSAIHGPCRDKLFLLRECCSLSDVDFVTRFLSIGAPVKGEHVIRVNRLSRKEAALVTK